MAHHGNISMIRSTVGECNGVSSEDRWEKETLLFARQIAAHITSDVKIVAEHGCGVGRMAKAVLDERPDVELIGLDDSQRQLDTALAYVNHEKFETMLSRDLNKQVDLFYCIYVLQHTPAIEVRDVLQRIHNWLKPGGTFICCMSEMRMAVCFDKPRFFDDRFLGVSLAHEVERFFEPVAPLFDEKTIASEEILQRILLAQRCPTPNNTYIPHHAKVYRRRDITGPLFNVAR